jgi:hypothetical protein
MVVGDRVWGEDPSLVAEVAQRFRAGLTPKPVI